MEKIDIECYFWRERDQINHVYDNLFLNCVNEALVTFPFSEIWSVVKGEVWASLG